MVPRLENSQPIALVASLFAAALALQTTPPSASPRLAVFTARAERGEGVRVVSTVESRLAGTVAVGGVVLRELDESLAVHVAFDATVASSTDDASVVRLDYKDCRSTASTSADESETKLPTSDRSLLVTRQKKGAADPSKLAVCNAPPELGDDATSSGGEPLSDVDEKAVAPRARVDAHELLFHGVFAQLLTVRKLEPGVAFELPSDLALALIAGAAEAGALELDGARFVRCSLTPRAAKRSNGVDGVACDVALELATRKGKELPVESSFTLAGEVVVASATGRLLAVELTGPVRFGGATEQGGRKVEVAGTGSFTWKYSAAPWPAP